MMKCPHCGSTAQVKNAFPPTISRNGRILTEGFDCGCGCHFTVDYERNEQGAWEHSWTSVEFIEKK